MGYIADEIRKRLDATTLQGQQDQPQPPDKSNAQAPGKKVNPELYMDPENPETKGLCGMVSERRSEITPSGSKGCPKN